MRYTIKGAALLILTLGMGYVVSVLASKEKGLLKTLGYVIAVIIVVALVLGALMPICRSSGIGCPIMKSICAPK